MLGKSETWNPGNSVQTLQNQDVTEIFSAHVLGTRADSVSVNIIYVSSSFSSILIDTVTGKRGFRNH